MRKAISLLFVLAIICCAGRALAGAWGQEAGKGLFITNFTYYQSSTYWDTSGKVRNSGSSFHKYEFNPYFEYGIAQGWTVTANGFYHYLTQTAEGSGKTWQSSGVQDTELGLQRQLFASGGFVSAVKATGIVPAGYALDSIPPLGYARFGGQGDLLVGYSWQALGGRNFFMDLSAGYRAYLDYPSPQLRSLFTFGADLTSFLQLLVQGDLQYGLDSSARKQEDTIALSAYYRLFKQITQLRVRLSENYSFAVGYSWNVCGENTGMGGGPVASLWYAF